MGRDPQETASGPLVPFGPTKNIPVGTEHVIKGQVDDIVLVVAPRVTGEAIEAEEFPVAAVTVRIEDLRRPSRNLTYNLENYRIPLVTTRIRGRRR